jgi:hypothetical protein
MCLAAVENVSQPDKKDSCYAVGCSRGYPSFFGSTRPFAVRIAKTVGFTFPKVGDWQKQLDLCFQKLGIGKNNWIYVSKSWGLAKTIGFMFPKVGDWQKQLDLRFQKLGIGKNNWIYVSKSWGLAKTVGFMFPKVGERQKQLNLRFQNLGKGKK